MVLFYDDTIPLINIILPKPFCYSLKRDCYRFRLQREYSVFARNRGSIVGPNALDVILYIRLTTRLTITIR